MRQGTEVRRELSAGSGDLAAVKFRKGTKREEAIARVQTVNWWTAGCAGASRRVRARTIWLETCLRARLAVKGFARGWCGGGILAVSRLHGVKIRCTCGNPSVIHPGMACPVGVAESCGLLSSKSITDAGVTFLRDDWNNNGQDITTMNFHGCGTGTNAENVTDTALQTESTTVLNPDSTRATGTRSVPASNQYRSVGTVTFDGSASITEHGILSQSATGGGSLWDRSVFTAIAVANGDSIQFTYTLTLSSGG